MLLRNITEISIKLLDILKDSNLPELLSSLTNKFTNKNDPKPDNFFSKYNGFLRKKFIEKMNSIKDDTFKFHEKNSKFIHRFDTLSQKIEETRLNLENDQKNYKEKIQKKIDDLFEKKISKLRNLTKDRSEKLNIRVDTLEIGLESRLDLIQRKKTELRKTIEIEFSAIPLNHLHPEIKYINPETRIKAKQFGLIEYDKELKNYLMSDGKYLAQMRDNKEIWAKKGSFWDVKFIDGRFWIHDYVNFKIMTKKSNEKFTSFFCKTEEYGVSWGSIINKLEGAKYMCLMFKKNLHFVEVQKTFKIGLELKIEGDKFGEGNFCKIIPLRHNEFLVLKSNCFLFKIKLKKEYSIIYGYYITHTTVYRYKVGVKGKEEKAQNMEVCSEGKYLFIARGELDCVNELSTSLSVIKLGDKLELLKIIDLTGKNHYNFFCFSFYKFFGNLAVLCGGLHDKCENRVCTYVFDTEKSEFEYIGGLDQKVEERVLNLSRGSDGSLRGYCDGKVVVIDYLMGVYEFG